ncbi:MAG: hypothetical protein HOP31_16270 [Ignavibacteria bacterium]|nr:hypothetical protein [Ignavibacteria bacterium]
MKVMSPAKIYLLIASILMFFSFHSCDGIFPSQSKSNVPSDHNNNHGGAFHKGEDDSDDCDECHGNDLRGKVYNYNGTLVITSSCFQCHGNVWEGEGGDIKFYFKKRAIK